MKVEEYYEKMMPKIKHDSNVKPSEFTKLFDILLEINICDAIIEKNFKIQNQKFKKDEIISYRNKLLDELKKLKVMKGEVI